MAHSEVATSYGGTGEEQGPLTLHADWLLAYCTGVMAIVGYCLWLAHQGMDPTIAMGVGLITFVISAVAILLSQDKWERSSR